MNLRNSLPFFPNRLFVRGLIILGLGTGLAGIFFLWLLSTSSDSSEIEAVKKQSPPFSELSIDLGGATSRPFFPFPAIDQEISISFDPPRPDRGSQKNSNILVRLKLAAQSRRVTLPCHIGLRYCQEKISFAEEDSLFWMELAPLSTGQMEARVFIDGISEYPTLFTLAPQEPPFLSIEELPADSPFRILAESRWWGRDLFSEMYKGSQASFERIEIGPLALSELLELRENEWLAWIDGKWQKINSLEEGKETAVARFLPEKGKMPAMEGWDKENYYRFRLTQPLPVPFKVRPEELFSSIRIRSDKQISCMIEKQCFILKTGDWVFKGDGRWKVLRKKEEREALEAGKLVGEIFVFDKIDVKQGQKMVQGHLFNLSRSQSIPIELPVSPSKSGGKAAERKARMRPR